MIESLFKQRSTLDRLQSGPLAQYLPSIADALYREQYPPETIRRYVRVADGFGRWLSKRGLNRLRACGADNGTANRTPPAWMISLVILLAQRQIVFFVWVTFGERK